MRILHPGQVVVPLTNYRGSNSITFTDGRKRKVYVPSQYELEHTDGSFFFCTKEQKENDCVHSKVLLAPSKGADDHAFWGSLVSVKEYKGYLLSCQERGPNGQKYYTEWYSTLEGDIVHVYNFDGAMDVVSFPGWSLKPTGGFDFRFDRISYQWREKDLYIAKKSILCSIHGPLNASEKLRGTITIKSSNPDFPPGMVVTTDNGFLYEIQAASSEQLREEVYTRLRDFLDPYLRATWAYYPDWKKYPRTSPGFPVSITNYALCKVVGSEPDPDFSGLGRFLFDEPNRIISHIRFASDRTSGYWYNWLVEHAYYEALDSVPVLNDNNIANIADICRFISDLVIHKRISIPKNLQDAWLSYRYVYSTGKSDIEDAIEFMHRNADMDILSHPSYKCYGSSSTEYRGSRVHCNCKMIVRQKELDYLSQLWVNLYQFGLAPDFYVIWDMVPYSFIVDWLIPVGDVLEVTDASLIYGQETFDIQDVVFSLSYDSVVDTICYHYYSRWTSEPIQRLNGLYWLDKPQASGKTWVTRALDAVSLIVRR